MSKLKDIIDVMAGSYSDLNQLARGQVVDANEVAKAISKADPDSVNMVVLQALAKWNPVKESEPVEQPKED
jgi:hypothetical protein